MLSISVIKSSKQAVSYYEKDDYYNGDGEDAKPQGVWFGKGAEHLGLTGENGGNVDREVFKQLLEGRLVLKEDGTLAINPDGSPSDQGDSVQIGRRSSGEIAHTPGYDLTFSAPKSVSIALSIGGDERLLEAHEESVKEALTWIEKNVASYREHGFFKINDINSENIVAGLFQHDTSRNQDPQLHTHAVVMNLTQREDDSWASLNLKPILEYKLATGNVYRAALALKVQELGYEIDRTGIDGRFELAAIPEEMRDLFATRRQEIEASLKERGLSGAEASATAAIRTRSRKVRADKSELTAEWHERAESAGFDISDAIATARSAGDQTPTAPFSASHAVRNAIDRVSEPEAVFSRPDLIRWSLAGSIGKAKADEICPAIDAEHQSRGLQEADHKRIKGWTTPRAKEQERRVLKNVGEGKHQVAQVYTSKEVAAELNDSGLNTGQQEAAHLILTSKDRFVGVLGRPGTGKTFLLSKTRELLEARGLTVVGMAANSEAARKLEVDSGIKSGTLASHLARVSQDLTRMKNADKAQAMEIKEKYTKSVWTLDEASQVSSGQMRRLTFMADKLGARVVLVGDPAQLGAIDAGKPFQLMLDNGLKKVEMDQIRRQSNPEHVKAIRESIAGQPGAALRILKDNIVEIHDRETRLEHIVQAWAGLGEKRKETYVLTAANSEKNVLNDAMRGVLREEGMLKHESPQLQLSRVFSRRADRAEADTYRPGNQVRFNRAVPQLGVESGEFVRVVATNRKTNVVTIERSTAEGAIRVDWNPSQVGGKSPKALEIYQERDTSLAPGEKIRWSRNNKELGINNGQILTVKDAKHDHVNVVRADGSEVSIDTSKIGNRTWSHAYAQTIYSSQGGTTPHVLVNLDSDKGKLLDQKGFLVAISRHQDTIRLFVDNAEGFREKVEKLTGEKSSALEGQLEAQARRRESLLQNSLRALSSAYLGIIGAPNKSPAQKELER